MGVFRYKLVLTCVLVLCMCISCSTRKQRLEQEYLEFSSTRISLPDEMLCVQEGSIKKTPLGNAPYDSNRHIPSNRLFHQFLIKSDGIPIFVGSPLTSSEMSQLFYDTLKTLNIIPNS